MAGRGRNRVPEIRRRQGEPRTGPDRPDFGPRRLRRRVPAQGRSARRKQRKFRFCRRGFAAARQCRQSAALADLAATAASAGLALPAGVFISGLSGGIALSRAVLFQQRAAPTGLRFRAERADFIDRPGRPARGRRHRTAARRHAGLKPAARARISTSLRQPIRRAAHRRLTRSRPSRCRGSDPRKATRSPRSGRSR